MARRKTPNLSGWVEKLFRVFLPSPFSLAILLTAFTFALGMAFSLPQLPPAHRAVELLHQWTQGIWDSPMLVFAVQMMLILVLGHSLALSPPLARAIDKITSLPNTGAAAAALIAGCSLLAGWINWGMGLVLGAILAREMAQTLNRRGISYSYPVLGAAGYLSMLVFHGGLSGSAPLKVAEPHHLQNLMGVERSATLNLPVSIPVENTLFHPINLTVSAFLAIALTALFFWFGRNKNEPAPVVSTLPFAPPEKEPEGAEWLDRRFLLSGILGMALLLEGVLSAGQQHQGLAFLTPNYLNQMMLGLGLVLHGSIASYLKAVDQAIGGAAGILIQFPLYFGIMGMLRSSGLLLNLAEALTHWTGPNGFALTTLFSAGLLNILVPSGGGQWSIQGPVIIETATQLGVPLNKAVMALAYGDELTNMLQPFWALPLLAITGLQAKRVLPYTAAAMLVAALLFGLALVLWH